MAFPYVVQILEQCQIAPPSGSVSTTSLPLSYMDIVMITQPTVQRLFFYQVDHSKTHFFSTVLPNLKHSLSLTLQQFFPLAGHLKWPQDSHKPTILYVDGESTVSLTVAESDYDFHQLSGNHPKDALVCYPLVPELSTMSESDSSALAVLALQITLFPNRGLCIGVTYHHTVADGKILIQFVRSWASVCRSHGDTSFMLESPLFYDRGMVKDTKGIEMSLLEKAKITRETFAIPKNNAIPVDKVRATFVLRRCDVMRIKKWILNRRREKDDEQPWRLSTFVITCAYVWVCLIKARRGESAAQNAGGIEDPLEVFGFAVDCRARIDPPLPSTYFGNCIRIGVATGKASELIGEDGIAIAAEHIAMVIPTIKDGEGILKDVETARSYLSSAPERCLSVAGSPKLGVYDTDFSWGIPKKVEVVSIATSGSISLTECPYEVGAVEVGLARDKIQLEVFTSLFANTMESLPPLLD